MGSDCNPKCECRTGGVTPPYSSPNVFNLEPVPVARRIPVGPFPHYYAIVDEEDYGYLLQFKWHIKSKNPNYPDDIYAATGKASEFMHRIITGFSKTDHINGVGLDNRRENLRAATSRENRQNSRKDRQYRGGPTTSVFKGVSFDKSKTLWRARITLSGKLMHLGWFSNEEDAARAYDTSALALFGDFAKLNFKEET